MANVAGQPFYTPHTPERTISTVCIYYLLQHLSDSGLLFLSETDDCRLMLFLRRGFYGLDFGSVFLLDCGLDNFNCVGRPDLALFPSVGLVDLRIISGTAQNSIFELLFPLIGSLDSFVFHSAKASV